MQKNCILQLKIKIQKMNSAKSLIFILFIMITIDIDAQLIDKKINASDTTVKISSKADAFTLLETGSIVPDFLITTINGVKYQLSALKGKTLVLNFFTLSCPMCMKELPLLEKEIWLRFKDREDVVILAIGREEPVDKLIVYKEKKKLSIPMASDPNRAVFSLFAIQNVPRNIVINKEGKLVLSEVGFTEEKAADLFQLIENEIKK